MNASILAALNALQAVMTWLTWRGISRDRIIKLLNRADAEGRDLTDAEVQSELDATAADLDATGDLIDGD